MLTITINSIKESIIERSCSGGLIKKRVLFADYSDQDLLVVSLNVNLLVSAVFVHQKKSNGLQIIDSTMGNN